MKPVPRALRFPKGRLLVFAKAPVAGQVKTRLSPFLDPNACARLQQWLIERTLRVATEAALCPIDVWCTPDPSHPFFTECVRRFGVRTRPQLGPDLGTRMYHALSATLTHADFAVIIGCDCAALDAAYLTQACEILSLGDAVVLGPAEDGGYVLIGVHQARAIGARRTSAELFKGLAWGTAAVLAETRQRLHKLAWRWVELTPLWDLDRPGDLARLAAACPDTPGEFIPRATRASHLQSADSRVPP